jgi:hypothetical protein
MDLLDQVYNSHRVPGFLVNSLPKSGTNLLKKAVSGLAGIRSSGIAFDHDAGVRLAQQPEAQQGTVPLGVGWPVCAPREAVRSALQQVPHGCYAFAHVPFSPGIAELLVELDMKSVLILRDPRDAVVSYVNYIATSRTNLLFNYFEPLTQAERITIAIVGIPEDGKGVMRKGIKDSLTSMLPWSSQPFNYTTRFEQLVGPVGGGTREAQVRELEAIAEHLGARLSRRRLESIADGLFGGTPTFSRGAIGAWHEVFTPEHKQLAKELLGELLIKLGYERDWDW